MSDTPPQSVHPLTRAAWRAWLAQHHADATGVWLITYKKATGKPRVAYDEAVEEALCFGWIDSIGRRIDDERYQVRFTPRRKGSVWSAVNIAAVARLTEQGLMHPAGQHAFDTRRPDRVAVYSYEQPADAQLDEAQLALFRADDQAWAWFGAQPPSYRRAAVHWVVSAKRAETRERRLQQLIDDSAHQRRVPPLVRR